MSFGNDEDALWTLARGAVLVDRCAKEAVSCKPPNCAVGARTQLLVTVIVCLHLALDMYQSMR